MEGNGRVYTVEYRTNLTTGSFQQLPGGTNLPATPPWNRWTNEAATTPTLFYRGKVQRED